MTSQFGKALVEARAGGRDERDRVPNVRLRGQGRRDGEAAQLAPPLLAPIVLPHLQAVVVAAGALLDVFAHVCVPFV